MTPLDELILYIENTFAPDGILFYNSDTDKDGLLWEDLKEKLRKNEFQKNQPPLKLSYKKGESCGHLAKEYNVTIGEIGCKKCGVSKHGMLVDDCCLFCGTPYFSNYELK